MKATARRAANAGADRSKPGKRAARLAPEGSEQTPPRTGEPCTRVSLARRVARNRRRPRDKGRPRRTGGIRETSTNRRRSNQSTRPGRPRNERPECNKRGPSPQTKRPALYLSRPLLRHGSTDVHGFTGAGGSPVHFISGREIIDRPREARERNARRHGDGRRPLGPPVRRGDRPIRLRKTRGKTAAGPGERVIAFLAIDRRSPGGGRTRDRRLGTWAGSGMWKENSLRSASEPSSLAAVMGSSTTVMSGASPSSALGAGPLQDSPGENSAAGARPAPSVAPVVLTRHRKTLQSGGQANRRARHSCDHFSCAHASISALREPRHARSPCHFGRVNSTPHPEGSARTEAPPCTAFRAPST